MKLVASLTSKANRLDFIKEVMQMPGGEKILDCIQCGLCAGSCPTRFAMDYSPMQILRMIHLGMKEPVLSSRTIWICATCQTCSTRCPRAVDITTLMISLRNLSIEEKLAQGDAKVKFHKAFFEVVQKYGRLHEPTLLTKTLKKSDIKGLFHNASLGWRLLEKGKLQLLPEKIEHVHDLSKMMKETNGDKDQ